MVLVLTNSTDSTSDYLIQRLEQADIVSTRLNTDFKIGDIGITYAPPLPALRIHNTVLRPQDIRAVILRRPEPLLVEKCEGADGRFICAEWSEVIEGFLAHIPKSKWINHPTANASCSAKMEQLTRAEQYGLRIPATLITDAPSTAREFLTRFRRAIIKPLSGGYVERADPKEDTLIYTSEVLESHLDHLHLSSNCPVLLQERIEKSADVRVCVIDNLSKAAMLLARDNDEQRLDIRRDNMEDVEYQAVALPEGTKQSLLNLISSYSLRFAAVDFVIDESGEWCFLEINPNGQWAWLDIVGNQDIANLFIHALQ